MLRRSTKLRDCLMRLTPYSSPKGSRVSPRPYKPLLPSINTHTHPDSIPSISTTMLSRSAGPITQDWDPIVLSRKRPKAADSKDPRAVNQALRSGAAVETVKKHDAGQNKKASSSAAPVVYARKLDEQTEPAALDRVAAEVRLSIQKARLAKMMGQAELAKQINERVQVVQEYESGKAVVNQAVLAKMERVLGVKLRGKINK